MLRFLSLIALLISLALVPVQTQAQELNCRVFVEDASLGIPMTRNGLELDRVDLIWLLPTDRDRLRGYVSIDARNQTVSRVGTFDISTGSEDPGSHQEYALLLDSTDWQRGAIDLRFCVGSGVSHGVLISYYQIPGRTGPDRYHPQVSYWTDNFNSGIRVAQNNDDSGGHDSTYHSMANTVMEATGVEVPDYVGNSLFLEAQIFAAQESSRRAVPLYWPIGASLSGDQIFVENLDNAVLALNTVTSVQQQGEELLGADGVIRNLVPGSGSLEVYTEGRMQLLQVVEGRLDARLEPVDATTRTFAGEMLHDLPVGSLTAAPVPWWSANSVDVSVNDRQFELEYPNAERLVLGNRVTDEGQYLVWSTEEAVPPLQYSLCAIVKSLADYDSGVNHAGGCLDLSIEEARVLLGREAPLDIAINRDYDCRANLGIPYSTIDSLVSHARSALPIPSWARVREYLKAGRVNTLVDGDGDGLICNDGEMVGNRYVIRSIQIKSVRNVAKLLD